jgi:hypothetical protein
MMKRALFLILLGAFCTSAALAANKREVTFKVTGQSSAGVLTANITGGSAHFEFYLDQLPDGSLAYQADITWNNGSAHEVYGLVPFSAIKTHGPSGTIQVNITQQMLYDVGTPGGDIDDFFSFEGTFTTYTGNGSSTNVQSGHSQETDVHLDGSQQIFKFNGTVNDHSATFEGVLDVTGGPYNLSVEAPDPSAGVQVFVGIQTDITITP